MPRVIMKQSISSLSGLGVGVADALSADVGTTNGMVLTSAMQAALIAYLGEDHVWTAQQSFADFYLLDNGTATYKAVDIFNGAIRVNGTAIGGGSLTVTEVDGSPSLTATTLRFPNGTVTDAGGGVAALSVLPSSVTKAELNTAVSDGNVVFVGDALNGTLGATTPASVAATTGAFSGTLTLGNSGVLVGGTNLIEQYNSTNAQTLSMYGSRSDASNYVRLRISTTTAGVCTLTAEGLGTGATYNGSNNTMNLAVASKVGYRHDGGNGWIYLQPNGNLGSSGILYLGGDQFRVGSTWVLYACSTADAGGTPDASISRSSPGVWKMGTGGNNALGSLLLTNLTASGTVILGTYTVGTLPSAASNTRARAFAVDSNLAFNSTNLGSTVTAGGSNLVPVFSNGTNWVIG